MNKLTLINKVKEIYQSGGNMMDFLRNDSCQNDIDSIMISYDFQAGSYIELASKNLEYFDKYTSALMTVVSAFGSIDSIMEVGVGEATMMTPLMIKLDKENKLKKIGFDISWSRVRYAKDYAKKFNQNIDLFVGNLFSIPLASDSVDVVYTSHSLEPNGGFEKQALSELCRVASKYVILLEPDFENASDEGKQRMLRHGYVRDLARHASELGYNVIEDKAFDVYINALNPTRLTVISKSTSSMNKKDIFQCPVSKTELKKINGCWFSEQSGILYPEIDEIPCLLEQNAILATKFLQFNS